MKKLIAVLSLGMLVAGSSYAQTATPQKERKHRTEHRDAKGGKAQKSPEDMAQMKTDRLSQKLDLNASQKNQLQALNKRHAEEMKAMREQYNGTTDKAQMREAKRASHDRWQAELKGILTEQQYATFEADRAGMHSRHGEGKRGHNGKGQKSGEFKKQRS